MMKNNFTTQDNININERNGNTDCFSSYNFKNIANNQQSTSKDFIRSGVIDNLAYNNKLISNSKSNSTEIPLSDDESSWKFSVTSLTTMEVEANKRKALEQRKLLSNATRANKIKADSVKTNSIKPISKKPKSYNYTDDEDDDDNDDFLINRDSRILNDMKLDNILKYKKSFNSNLLNDTFNDKENELFKMQVSKAYYNKEQRNERVLKRNEISPMVASSSSSVHLIKDNVNHNNNIKKMWDNISNVTLNGLNDIDIETNVKSKIISIDNSNTNRNNHKSSIIDLNSDDDDSDVHINRNQKRTKTIAIIQSPDMELIDSDDHQYITQNNNKHENKLRKNSNLVKGNNTMKSSNTSNFIDLVGNNNNNNSDEECVMKSKKVIKKTNIKTNKQIIKKRQIASSSSDNNNSSDDDDDSCNGEEGVNQLGRKDIQAQAHVILNKCKDFSGNLRASLIAWETGGDISPITISTSTNKNINSSKGNSNKGEIKQQSLAVDRDCIDLTSIKSPIVNNNNNNTNNKDGSSNSSSQILSDDDIKLVCPGLKLKSYQLVGINWLKLLHENHVNGVLADDMGLGKTVQTISFLGWLNSTMKKRSKPHLIVVPASTLSNWQNELRKFCPSFDVVVYHGSQNERMELRYILKNPHANVDVILSTYTIFERESSKSDRSFMYSLEFEYLVLDEAHCIKNADSSRYNNLNALKTNHRLLLSGTPVQNDIGELLSMLSFLMPKVFGRRNRELLIEALNWSMNKNINTLTTTTNTTSNDMITNNKKYQPQEGELSLLQLRSILAPFVLRRLKKHVLDQLSDKVTIVKRLTMTTFQKEVYDNILLDHTARKDYFKLKQKENVMNDSILNGKYIKNNPSKEEIIDLTTTTTTTTTDKESVLTNATINTANNIIQPNEILKKMSTTEANHLFTALRKVANHPLLLRVRYKDPIILDRIATVAYHNNYFGNQCDYQRVRDEIDLMSDFDLHYLCLEYSSQLAGLELTASVLYDSPKMEFLKNFLPQLKSEGHRMLIFSQWTRLLDLLEVLMQDIGFLYLRLDGATPVKERQDLIDRFSTQENIPVFLLSTKAGGLGINLTSADTVILHDLDFNPENDKQAEDRCHRIGQMKPVTIYKLYAEETVDEDIYEMGERKSKLSKAVLADDDQNHINTTTNHNNSNSSTNSSTKSPKNNNNIHDETYLISNILQKALLRKLSQV